MTRDQDLAVVRRVQKGDVEAFSLLVAAHQKNIYNLALRMTGNPSDAEDMTQETFFKAYRSLNRFRGESRFSVWLYRIASNECLDFLRRQKKQQTLPITVEDEDGREQELDIEDLSQSPEALLEQRMTRRAVREGLEHLQPEQRQILLLREIHGLSYEEIAEVLGLEAGTVKSRIFRARKKLCAFLLQNGNIPDDYASKKVKGGVAP